MRFITHLEVENYLILKNARLTDLKDLNIIIGPNNCGKTSILKAIAWLGTLKLGRFNPGYTCNICKNVYSKLTDVNSLTAQVEVRDKYLETGKVKVTFGYGQEDVDKLLPEFSNRRKSISTSSAFDDGVKSHLAEEFENENLTMIEAHDRNMVPQHVSPMILPDFKTALLDRILYCPDERLQTYKSKTIKDHIDSKDLPATELRRLIEYLRKFVDPNLTTIRHSLDLIKTVENTRFDTSIAEQGSGVKSLICLITDVLSETETKIILVDEPELGLNPLGKHELLRFLLEQCKNKQVFLATHDPTFVNPVLWKRGNVSVYLYSLIEGSFVKVDLAQSKQDPETFAGFLPHTTSLKQVHIYVEGMLDVYIFQAFLNKYIRRFRNWQQTLSKIGLFHLAGDFWSHLLYTIPKRPYISIVVLDGDKLKTAAKVVNDYTKVEENRFQFFNSLEELGKKKRASNINTPMPCPIYCLKMDKIEDYLSPRPSPKSQGPKIADKMKCVPSEIERLFDIILRWTGKRIKKPSKLQVSNKNPRSQSYA